MIATRVMVVLAVVALTLTACGNAGHQAPLLAAGAVSGQLEDGLRVVTLDARTRDQLIRVYRGDYVRPQLSSGEPFTLTIPTLQVDKSFPAPAGEPPYFKAELGGSFAFQAGKAAGRLEVIEYEAAAYREVSAREAVDLLDLQKPVILDVRTPGEFAEGHLEGAMLVPVQEFQQRLGELAAHKDDPVFVYCRSGNRSTVAAKMLVDAGFAQVINLRHGIREWTKEGLPVVK
jgi:rhodanese-related sulfurtransferase